MVKRCPECDAVVKPPYKKCDECGYSPRKGKSEKGPSRKEREPQRGRRPPREDREKPSRGGRPPRDEAEEKPRRGRRPPRDEEEEKPRRGRRPPRDEEDEKPRRGRRPPRDEGDKKPRRGRQPPREERGKPRKGRRPPREEEEKPRRGRPEKKEKAPPKYDPEKDPKVKEYDEGIQKIEEEIEGLKEELEGKKAALKVGEEDLGKKKKDYDELQKEKEEIEDDIQTEMTCPKCSTTVVVPDTREDTLHLKCDECGAKGRLPNPNKDTYLDLTDVEEELKGAKKSFDLAESKVSEFKDGISDTEKKVDNLSNEMEMKKEEKEEYIKEKVVAAPVGKDIPREREPSRERKKPREPEEEEEEDEEEEEVEQAEEDAFCPMCYADLTEPPFDKCSSCGWEEEKDYSEQPSAYDSYEYDEPAYEEPRDDFGSSLDNAGDYDPESRRKASKDHYQVDCRCGEKIDIWTSKRPAKIKCDHCGAKGNLKGMGKKVSEDYHGEFKYEKAEDHEKRSRDERTKDVLFCGECGARNVNNKFCSECGGPLGKEEKPPKPERKKGRRPPSGRGGKRRPGKGRGRAPPAKESKVSFEDLEEQAVDILVKLEKLLDKGSEKNIYFPEIEDEMDGLEEEIEKARNPNDLKKVIGRAKQLGSKVNKRLRSG
ncbi:MAG: hypothetical protein QF682_01690 [Candidatus Thermoplasmatota archaeon]|nr:hypothetical protein [Candidatus Thermoplasmatota archaeon]